MQIRFIRAEICLMLGLIAALAFACFGPTMAQYDHYHEFANQRAWVGLPFVLDVLSNLPFALFGGWGLWLLHRGETTVPTGTQRALAFLFFGGLVLTAACSSWYQLHPSDLRLVVDRLGMVVAFAGLLGIAVANRIRDKAGLSVAASAIVFGSLAVATWAANGNLLPWSAFQVSGMLLVVLLSWRKPAAEGWDVPLMAVVGWYTLAKVLELNDGIVFWVSGDLVSGHTLKHLAAAMAAFPIISVMHNGAEVSRQHMSSVHDLSMQ